MIDIPDVFKLGEGPEYGHVNCSFFLPKNFLGGLWITLSSRHAHLRCVIKITLEIVQFVYA
jgi:hypothetical protein